PDPEAARVCGDLHDALPSTVAGRDRRDTDPSSPYTAAWGDPALVLRCGVPRPAEMDNPKASGAEISGVDWVLEKQPDGGYRATTSFRTAYVEVALPPEYGDVAALVDLAEAVKRAVPRSL
ncbi:DUF3515 domain-containing protein, partial [Streptomyces solincola]